MLTRPSSAPATTTTAARERYAALGDSVAAGVGLQPDSDPSACNRTDASYPNQAAARLNLQLQNIACGGATLPAGILGKQDVNRLMVAAQLDQLFALPKPKLVTLTVGANDVGWTELIAKCYTGTCGTAQDTAAVQARLDTLAANMRQALGNMQNHYAAAPPDLIVTGYYQVFPDTIPATCRDLQGIDANELAWGRQQQAAINSTIQTAVADFPFAKFAGIDFSGHELCAADPWVQGIGDKQPYHPTAAGQTAYAKQIVTAAKAFK